ncbi:MAG: hypothetical protein MMC33_006669 [Icmadophila ericetorum]|nr:hypothetical protein [Icmadophila ericetorum]
MAPAQFKTPLEASSCNSPSGGEAYAPLRKRIIENAIAMGYNAESMVECGVRWEDDQDPFGHVAGPAYPRYVGICNLRVIESFAEWLKDKYDDMVNARGIGILAKAYTVDVKRPVTYPDSLIVANRLTDILPDRYHGITSIWSLRQQALVAEIRGWMVFVDVKVNKPANLVKAGGVYLDLHSALTRRVIESRKLASKWESEQAKRPRSKL